MISIGLISILFNDLWIFSKTGKSHESPVQTPKKSLPKVTVKAFVLDFRDSRTDSEFNKLAAPLGFRADAHQGRVRSFRPGGFGMSQGPPGSFLRSYTKPWLDFPDQIRILESRGLTVGDHGAAIAFLSHVNYYRFSGYALAFESAKHRFQPGSTFEQIRATYDFDFQVRDLLNEALELVEIDLRTNVAHQFGKIYGPFGHAEAKHFSNQGKHQNWYAKFLDEVQRSKERFVKHFQNTYKEYPNLPIWSATEIMSFGSLSTMVSAMLSTDQRNLSARYGLQANILTSWMHHLVYIRNLCAHHCRVWDRIWSIQPACPPGNAWKPPELAGTQRLFCTLLILYRMLLKCPEVGSFPLDWKNRVEELVSRPPPAPKASFYLGGNIPLTANSLWKANK